MASRLAFPKRPKAPRAPSGLRIRFPKAPEPMLQTKPYTETAANEDELERWRIWEAQYAGSFLEFLVWEWLVKVKKQVSGLDFVFQAPFFGGRTQFGGFVADFVFPTRQMIWNPAGLKWHYTNPGDRARDALSKILLAQKGYTVIFLYEDDLLNRKEYTLSNAWRGIEVGFRRLFSG